MFFHHLKFSYNFLSMSQFSFNQSDKVSEARNKGKKKKPQWLEEFLRRTFFEPCEIHPIRRNETNRYCINCNLSACQYCMSSPTHRHHNILKIYRHVYKDVVSLTAMDNLIDCSHIQPYKCNKQLVISLNPLPHCGLQSNHGVCAVCGRRLAEPDLYHYCSISCKGAAFERKLKELDPPYLLIPNNQTKTNQTAYEDEDEDDEEEEQGSATSTAAPIKRRRKGTPTRAPFF